jgi:hypothetical protein
MFKYGPFHNLQQRSNVPNVPTLIKVLVRYKDLSNILYSYYTSDFTTHQDFKNYFDKDRNNSGVIKKILPCRVIGKCCTNCIFTISCYQVMFLSSRSFDCFLPSTNTILIIIIIRKNSLNTANHICTVEH